MNRNNKKGILVDGSLRAAGLTFYTKEDQTVVRAAASRQPKRRTVKQFDIREKFLHKLSLWQVLAPHCDDLFPGEGSAYRRFLALAAKLPPLYLTRYEYACRGALLLPGIPVSDGTVPDIRYGLTAVEGRPALVTDLPAGCMGAGERLRLVELRQYDTQGLPRLRARHEELRAADCDQVEGRIALIDSRFGDSDGGWALVREYEGRCSTQRVVTAATRWREYTTPAARHRAAESFGGITESEK